MKFKVQKRKFVPLLKSRRTTGKLYYKYRGKTKRPKYKRS